MRLWHYKFVEVLPQKQLVSQWRECIAIKRQWEKGTLIHPLVSYVKDYNKEVFFEYSKLIYEELIRRNYKPQYVLLDEIYEWSKDDYIISNKHRYKEHNKEYLTICYYNLKEKYLRGIITDEEFKKIENIY